MTKMKIVGQEEIVKMSNLPEGVGGTYPKFPLPLLLGD